MINNNNNETCCKNCVFQPFVYLQLVTININNYINSNWLKTNKIRHQKIINDKMYICKKKLYSHHLIIY